MKTELCRPIFVKSEINTNIWKKDFYLYTTPIVDGIPQELMLFSLEDKNLLKGGPMYLFNPKFFDHFNVDLVPSFAGYSGFVLKAYRLIARQSQIPIEYVNKFIDQFNNKNTEDILIEIEELSDNSMMITYSPKLIDGFVNIIERGITIKQIK